MAQKILGIDIGTYSVKAVRLKNRLGGGFEFIDSFCEPLDMNAADSAAEAADALKRMISTNRLGDDTIIGAVPSQKVSGRFLKLPLTDKRKIDQVIDYEVDNYVPFPSQSIVTDYQLASKSHDTPNVFIQVAMKSDVKSAVQIFEQAGVEAKYIDSETLSLFSALSYAFDDGERHALLDVGHTKSILTVIDNGEIAYSHTIDFGGGYINERISHGLGISIEEADNLKRGEHVPKDARGIIDDCLSEFADTLKRNIISFELMNKKPLGKILLTGGSSKMNGIERQLQDHLNISFVKAGINDLMQKSGRRAGDEASVVACGIALRARNTANISNIDFKRDKTTSIKESKYLYSSLIKVFIMVMVLLTFYTVDLFIKKQAQQAQLSEIDRQIFRSFNESFPDVTARGNELAVIKEKIKDASKQVERFGALLSKGITMLDIVSELSVRVSKVGEGQFVEIYECAFNGKRLSILGETQSYNQTDELKLSLEQSDLFGDVKMEYAKFTADHSKVKFSMKIALKREEGRGINEP